MKYNLDKIPLSEEFYEDDIWLPEIMEEVIFANNCKTWSKIADIGRHIFNKMLDSEIEEESLFDELITGISLASASAVFNLFSKIFSDINDVDMENDILASWYYGERSDLKHKRFIELIKCNYHDEKECRQMWE